MPEQTLAEIRTERGIAPLPKIDGSVGHADSGHGQNPLLSLRQRALLPVPVGSIRPSSRIFASVFET